MNTYSRGTAYVINALDFFSFFIDSCDSFIPTAAEISRKREDEEIQSLFRLGECGSARPHINAPRPLVYPISGSAYDTDFIISILEDALIDLDKFEAELGEKRAFNNLSYTS